MDEGGTVILAGKKTMLAEGDSMLLEGYAIRYAIQMAKQYCIKVDIVESDSKNLVELVEGIQRTVGYCEIIASDIKSLALEVGCRSIC